MDIKRMHCMIEKISKCADEQLEHGVEMADTEEKALAKTKLTALVNKIQ